MRLLNTRTITLDEFVNPPSYAILSHRWRNEEVLFHQIQDLSRAEMMKGYAKISRCCTQALQDGYEWVWIDTCCIDKTSSSELSETINSMYAWYRDARLCYAYLDDVRGDEDPDAADSSFRRSEWFTRGWTLQELIAPITVVFFSLDWKDIGTRQGLADTIQDITGVNRDVLVRLPVRLSVATRMSWASNRKTTRVEDRAYSLMGLFGVHMPTLYGEGSQAFFRLQYEIMKHSNDHSIFAWMGCGGEITTLSRFKFQQKTVHSTTNYGFLAYSPDSFAHANVVDVPYTEYAESLVITEPLLEYSVTNHGIRMRLPVVPTKSCGYWAVLSCALDNGTNARGRGRSYICVWLQPFAGMINQYYRANKDLILVDEDLTRFASKDVYVLQTSGGTLSDIFNIDLYLNPQYRDSHFQFTIEGPHDNCFELLTSTTEKEWRKTETGLAVAMSLPLHIFGESKFHSAVFRERATGRVFATIIGVDRVPAIRHCDGRIWLDILVEDRDNWLSTSTADERKQKLEGMYIEGSVLRLDPDHPRRRCSDKITKRFGRGWKWSKIMSRALWTCLPCLDSEIGGFKPIRLMKFDDGRVIELRYVESYSANFERQFGSSGEGWPPSSI